MRENKKLILIGQQGIGRFRLDRKYLLPTSTNKLFARWKEPFLVMGKISPVDYKIRLDESREGVPYQYIKSMGRQSYKGKGENIGMS